MRNILLFLSLSCATLSAGAYNTTITQRDEPPSWYAASFPFGNDSLVSYLQKNLTVPDTIHENSISFYVNAEGIPSGFQHTGDDSFAKRAEAVLEKLKFTPGSPNWNWYHEDDPKVIAQKQKDERFTLQFKGVTQEKSLDNAILLTSLQPADTTKDSITISGNLIDNIYHAPIEDAMVMFHDGRYVLKYASSDRNGNFSFTFDKHIPDLFLTVQYAGWYGDQTFKHIPWNNQTMNIQMQPSDDRDPYELILIGKIRLLTK